jgi:hypothetical protein
MQETRRNAVGIDLVPAFLISSWVDANRECAVEGIRVSRSGAPGQFYPCPSVIICG